MLKKLDILDSEIRRLYFVEKKSQKAISKELGVSQWTVFQRMKNSNMKAFPKERFLSHQVYCIKQDVLDCITTDVAWILGWFLSDGFVSKDANYFGCKVAIKDQSILEKIKDFFGYSGPILEQNSYLKKTKKIYKNKLLKMSSKVLRNKIIELGIKPAKTSKERYLKCINGEELDRAFIRGIFEGDGSLLVYPHRESYCFQIVGTKELLLEIQKRLIGYLGIQKTKLYCQNEKSNHYMMRYTGKHQVYKISEWIYRDNPKNRLERKYLKYQEMEAICQ
jgi:hypothetical protein